MRKLLFLILATVCASACGPSEYQHKVQLHRLSCESGVQVSCIDYAADLQRQNLAMAAIMSQPAPVQVNPWVK
jgi:hypothetical protein